MPQHISTNDPIWESLVTFTGLGYATEFREQFANEDRLIKLATGAYKSGLEKNHLAFAIHGEYIRYQDAQSGRQSIPDGVYIPKRPRKPVRGGHGDILPKDHRQKGIPGDPSEPISGMLAAMAIREYQPAIEAVRTIEDSGRLSYGASEFTRKITQIAELERQFVEDEPPTEADDDPEGNASYKAFMDAHIAGMGAAEARIRADRIRDRSKLLAYSKVADEINRHIDNVISTSPPATLEILTRADREVSQRPPLRGLRVFDDWAGNNPVSLQHQTGMRLTSAVERLSAILAAHYGWMEEHALVFVFANVPPPTGSIRVHYRMREDIPCQSRIILEFEPNVPEETVTQVYKLARRHVLPDKAKPKAIGAKMMALAIQAYSHGPLGNLDDPHVTHFHKMLKMDRWNENIAPHLKNLSRTLDGKAKVQKDATYKYLYRFEADCARARESLLSPPYKILNSEGYFITGTKLPAIELISKNSSSLLQIQLHNLSFAE